MPRQNQEPPTQLGGTKWGHLFTALAWPFEPEFVRTREQGGKVLRYVTAPTVLNRLDSVCGPENVDVHLERFGENSVLCRITLTLPDGSRVTKANVGANSRMSDRSQAVDPGDDDKGGASDAIKRSAAMFGVARYLSGDGVPDFVMEAATGEAAAELAPRQQAGYSGGGGGGGGYQRQEPRRDERQPASRPSQDERPAQSQPQDGSRSYGPPRTGKALFAFIKNHEDQHGQGLLKRLNEFGKQAGYPFRMIDWAEPQVAEAYAEAENFIGVPDGA